MGTGSKWSYVASLFNNHAYELYTLIFKIESRK